MADVRARIMEVSNATGISKEELLAGASAFTAFTGDGKTAAGSLDVFAKVAKASGSDMADIADTAAAMSSNFGVNAGQMEKTFSILIKGGKAGSIELNELAGVFKGLAPSWNQFAESKGPEGIARMSAALQVANKSFGSAAESATGLQGFVGQLSQHSDKLKKKKIKVWEVGPDGLKRMRSFDSILDDIATKLVDKKGMFDREQLNEIFRDKEGQKFIATLVENRKQYKALTAETMNASDVASDYAAVQSSASAQATLAWTQFKNTLSDFAASTAPAAAAALKGLATGVGFISDSIREFQDLGGWDTLFRGDKSIWEDLGDTAEEMGRTLTGQEVQATGVHRTRAMQEQVTQRQTANVLGRQGWQGPQFETVRARALRRAEASQAGMNQLTNQVTINAPSANAEEVAKLVRREMEGAWRRVINGGSAIPQ
jgi:TP901 family phage tail tape measure protein